MTTEQLWNEPGGSFHEAPIPPGAAGRYLTHASAAPFWPACAVRLRMHGEIRLKTWRPFTAEQVIVWNRGMIWQAATNIGGIPVRGSDRLIHGIGSSRWKLFGLVTIVNASGPDITRSVAGRINIESIWLPSVLRSNSVCWNSLDESRAEAAITAHGEESRLDLTLHADGALKTVCVSRWGNPGAGDFRYVPCGGVIEEEKTFQGWTIPTRVRVGWYFGTPRFEQDGEFFRATIDSAVYR